MSTSGGLPRTPPQRRPLGRGAKEAFVALAALPVLLVAGVFLGGRLTDSGPSDLRPAPPIAGAPRTPSPAVKVKPRRPIARATAAAPGGKQPAPVRTGQVPAAAVATKPAAPVATKAPAPAPVAPARPPAPPAPQPVNPALPPALRAVAPVAPPPGPGSTLVLGSTGADVRTWQRQMARRTWRIKVDGVFGPRSQRIARLFQVDKGLPVTGRVDQRTWDATWLRRVTL